VAETPDVAARFGRKLPAAEGRSPSRSERSTDCCLNRWPPVLAALTAWIRTAAGVSRTLTNDRVIVPQTASACNGGSHAQFQIISQWIGRSSSTHERQSASLDLEISTDYQYLVVFPRAAATIVRRSERFKC